MVIVTNNRENLLYFLNDMPYINMTNCCTNSCVFCVREQKEDVQGAKLWLREDSVSAADVIAQIEGNIERVMKAGTVVFCGYGEPLIRIEQVLEICKYIKEKYPELKIRINTNGHANAIHKRNVAQDLAPYIDEISISLNAQNEETYNKISNPKIDNAYEEVKRFIRASIEAGISTTATVVSGFKDCPVDVERSRVIAESLKAKFRVREFIENGY